MDPEIRTALRLVRTKTLHDALAYTLELEAAKQASRWLNSVRELIVASENIEGVHPHPACEG